MKSHIVINEAELHHLFHDAHGPLANSMYDKAGPVLDEMVATCPVDTGQLKLALDKRVVDGDRGVEAHIGVFEQYTDRDEGATTNAEVFLYQELGAPRANVPALHFASLALMMVRG